MIPIAVVLALVSTSASAESPAPEPPRVQLADMDRLKSVVQAERTRALLVVFWATWCAPCVEEIPDLVALHESSSEDLEIVAVSLDAFLHAPEKSLDLVRAQLATIPTQYPHFVYTDGQDPLFTFFDIPGGIPYAVLYDHAGNALQRFPGKVAPDVVRDTLGLTKEDG